MGAIHDDMSVVRAHLEQAVKNVVGSIQRKEKKQQNGN